MYQYDKILQELINLGRDFESKRWVPATSGNFSVRLEKSLICITASGVHKGYLKEDDFVIVDLDGKIVHGSKKPSAETLLHLTIYRVLKDVESVLHIHSVNSTIISMVEKEDLIKLYGYEILKGFRNVKTHEVSIEVPIFENSQNMQELSEKVQNYLENNGSFFGFLIRAHGIYTWGKDIAEAAMNLEIFDFIFECELKLKQGGWKT